MGVPPSGLVAASTETRRAVAAGNRSMSTETRLNTLALQDSEKSLIAQVLPMAMQVPAPPGQAPPRALQYTAPPVQRPSGRQVVPAAQGGSPARPQEGGTVAVLVPGPTQTLRS